MTIRSITATYLARNFSDLLDQVRYQKIALEVTRGNEIVACIAPPAGVTGYPIDQLDRLFDALPRLSDEENQQFLIDLHEGAASSTGPVAVVAIL